MAYLALYRRYRPKNFDEIVGQDSITQILRNQIQFNRVGHAYLFSGIRGTGKTSLAKIFAKAINCPNGVNGNPCNNCEICINIDRSGIMDIIEIDGASNRGVDEIREIREKVKYPPTVGQYKVYIIDEVHMLTKEAFNALLKTLEEPPEHVVFILATTEPNKCPSTILSRCQRYEIRPIAKNLIVKQMKKICSDIGVTMTDQSFDFIAIRGENSMRDALSLLDQIIDLQDKDGHVDFDDLLNFTGMSDKAGIHEILKSIIEKDPGAVLLLLRKFVNKGKNSTLLMDQIIEYLRGVLITKTASDSALDILGCSQEEMNDFALLGKKLEFNQIYHMIHHLIEEKNKLKYSSLQGIIVEMAILKLCLIEDHPNETIIKEKIISENEIKNRFDHNKNTEIKPKNYQNSVNNQVIKEKEALYTMPQDSEIIDSEENSGMIEVLNSTAKNIEIEKNTEKTDKIKSKEQSDTSEKPVKQDEMRLFKKLCDEVSKTNSGQAMFLKRGEATLKDDNQLIIHYSKENQNYFQFLNKPELMRSFENILFEKTKIPIKIDIKLEEENFNQLDLFEKTKEIVNDNNVKIIDIEG